MVKRRYMVLTHKAIADGNFTLEDMPGSGGRMDIAARAITAALLVSHGIRRDTEVIIHFRRPEETCLKVSGQHVRYLNPDERSTGALIRNALIKYQRKRADGKLVEGQSLRASPGIEVSPTTLEELLQSSLEGTLAYLHEEGEDALTACPQFKPPVTLILSDSMDSDAREMELITTYSHHTISLGPQIEHTDHCIVIMNNILDRVNNIQ